MPFKQHLFSLFVLMGGMLGTAHGQTSDQTPQDVLQPHAPPKYLPPQQIDLFFQRNGFSKDENDSIVFEYDDINNNDTLDSGESYVIERYFGACTKITVYPPGLDFSIQSPDDFSIHIQTEGDEGGNRYRVPGADNALRRALLPQREEPSNNSHSPTQPIIF